MRNIAPFFAGAVFALTAAGVGMNLRSRAQEESPPAEVDRTYVIGRFTDSRIGRQSETFVSQDMTEIMKRMKQWEQEDQK